MAQVEITDANRNRGDPVDATEKSGTETEYETFRECGRAWAEDPANAMQLKRLARDVKSENNSCFAILKLVEWYDRDGSAAQIYANLMCRRYEHDSMEGGELDEFWRDICDRYGPGPSAAHEFFVEDDSGAMAEFVEGAMAVWDARA